MLISKARGICHLITLYPHIQRDEGAAAEAARDLLIQAEEAIDKVITGTAEVTHE